MRFVTSTEEQAHVCCKNDRYNLSFLLIPQERRKGLSRHCAKLRAEAAFARLLDETPGLAADTPWPVVKRKVRAGLQSPSPISFKRGRKMQTCPGLLREVRGGGNGAGMVFPYPVLNQTSFKSIRLAHRYSKHTAGSYLPGRVLRPKCTNSSLLFSMQRSP